MSERRAGAGHAFQSFREALNELLLECLSDEGDSNLLASISQREALTPW